MTKPTEFRASNSPRGRSRFQTRPESGSKIIELQGADLNGQIAWPLSGQAKHLLVRPLPFVTPNVGVMCPAGCAAARIPSLAWKDALRFFPDHIDELSNDSRGVVAA